MSPADAGERKRIAGYVNLDMVGSPNAVRFVYGARRVRAALIAALKGRTCATRRPRSAGAPTTHRSRPPGSRSAGSTRARRSARPRARRALRRPRRPPARPLLPPALRHARARRRRRDGRARRRGGQRADRARLASLPRCGCHRPTRRPGGASWPSRSPPACAPDRRDRGRLGEPTTTSPRARRARRRAARSARAPRRSGPRRSCRCATRSGSSIVMRFNGPGPPAYVPRALHAGRAAGVILFKDNITSRPALKRLVAMLQRGARGSALVATDQEGGEIRNLPGRARSRASPPPRRPRAPAPTPAARRATCARRGSTSTSRRSPTWRRGRLGHERARVPGRPRRSRR